jgi:hypothetical protein
MNDSFIPIPQRQGRSPVITPSTVRSKGVPKVNGHRWDGQQINCWNCALNETPSMKEQPVSGADD